MRLLTSLLIVLATALGADAQSELVSSSLHIPDSIRTFLSSHATVPAEGVWSVPDGAIFAIYTHGDGRDGVPYDVVCLSSPNLRIPRGSKVGTLKRTDSSNGTYELALYTDVDHKGKPSALQRYKITVKDGNSITPGAFMSIERIRKGLKISPWMYFRFFISLRATEVKKDNVITARKIFPEPAISPEYPIIL